MTGRARYSAPSPPSTAINPDHSCAEVAPPGAVASLFVFQYALISKEDGALGRIVFAEKFRPGDVIPVGPGRRQRVLNVIEADSDEKYAPRHRSGLTEHTATPARSQAYRTTPDNLSDDAVAPVELLGASVRAKMRAAQNLGASLGADSADPSRGIRGYCSSRIAPVAQRKSSGLLSRGSGVRILPGALAAHMTNVATSGRRSRS